MDLTQFERAEMTWLGEKPKYKTGDHVFYVRTLKGESRVTPTNIRSVPLDYYVIDDVPCLKFLSKYEITNMCSIDSEFDNPWNCHSFYVFETEEEANKAAKFWPVTSKKWLTMIGNRNIDKGKGNIHEGCELLSCCGRISTIRDCLERVRNYQGIIECDRQLLQQYIADCDCLPQKEDSPSLHKLFDSLELVHNERKEE